LPTDKLVLVSLSGFTRNAKRLASEYGIDTYTPDAAVKLDWAKIVGKLAALYVSRYNFTPVQCELIIATVDGDKTVPAGLDTLMETSQEVRTGNLHSVVSQVIQSLEPFGRQAMDAIEKATQGDGRSIVDFVFHVTPRPFAIDTEGRKHPVVGFKVKVNAEKVTAPVKMKSLSWKGIPVAFGSAKTALGDTTITVVEQDGSGVSMTMFADNKKLDLFP
jgi:hypothetical protein